MKNDTTLRVTEIQRYCMHDGPGVRTTVFLKGCPLRCAWCHNPETQKHTPELLFYQSKCVSCGACASVCPTHAHRLGEIHSIARQDCTLCSECASICPTGALDICGKELLISEILSEVEKDRAFYGESGGVTISGGEPFLHGQRLIELLIACKEHGFSTAVETCGFADPELIRAAAPYVDLFLWDLKDTDDARHRRYTGVSNESILKNLHLINDMNARIRLRCILVNGVNTDETHYRRIAELAKEIRNSDGVELLPYHAYGGSKATFIGQEDNGRTEWIPSKEEIGSARELLKAHGVKVLGA